MIPRFRLILVRVIVDLTWHVSQLRVVARALGNEHACNHRTKRRGRHHRFPDPMTGDAERAIAIAKDLRERLSNAVGLPEGDIASIRVLIDAGEWVVALESLCTQIYEYDLEPSADERERLRAIGRELGVQVAYLLGDPWADAGGGA